MNSEADYVNELKSKQRSLSDKYNQELKNQESQMYQEYKSRLNQLKAKYNHLLPNYYESNSWSD
jgi:hypothetical protein